MIWQNGKFYLQGSYVYGDMRIEGGSIAFLDSHIEPRDGEEVMDLAGALVTPGFVDIHTHGAVGVDVNGAEPEDLERLCRFFATQGTTSFLISILTDTEEQTRRAIEAYRQWKKLPHGGATIEGIHLEGPFLSAEYKGAMPEYLLKKPDLELISRYQDWAGGDIRYLTMAPELEGAVEIIPGLKQLGIQVSVGHSSADYHTVKRSAWNGAESSTHTGNAMKLLHQHFPAVLGGVMEDEGISCEMICDGRHLHPGIVRMLIKSKGLDKVVAVTDSMMAAGFPDGNYKLGVNDIVVVEGDAKLASNGTRAGSTLTAKQSFRNLLKFTDYSIRELLPLWTENPAKLVGLYGQIGSLHPGKRANCNILDEGGGGAADLCGRTGMSGS